MYICIHNYTYMRYTGVYIYICIFTYNVQYIYIYVYTNHTGDRLFKQKTFLLITPWYFFGFFEAKYLEYAGDPWVTDFAELRPCHGEMSALGLASGWLMDDLFSWLTNGF